MGIKGKATSLIEEFKAFAFKGNIVDMAIGVIIGGAFGKIVTSFVNDIVMPGVTALIAMGGAKDAGEGLKSLTYTTDAGVAIPYGNFIGGIVDFLIVAIVVFLVMKKFLGFMQNMRKAEEKPAEPPAPPAPPEPSAEEKLLTEIRDLLKK
ncbi:large conductance mechanosensitive channel [Fibrobacter sp. UWH9]|uniref:large conductance mechanosensitive channel protein MscL n=1 Tax=unclassified Fibrobacter TaxID=2634177 RepID=UPI000915E160|nr:MULTISPECIES: large conductance mechanosensitive channel protein MscL [Fibrobacter]MCL4103278.1 Large-conductance mechanosensitive channel [Fibrobacter succinogenes]MCQ2101246.1 large conductance mechanosensitive channel protein MscL [Fibrobacter sp.]SHH56803.1 large conductance mechanosensitive channel [Fibrobacter sp. UWH9]SHL13556.1 large conductance mechanosensitive channel [Fibrobacter sp. UWH5]